MTGPEHLAAAWLFLLGLAMALFALAALAERVGKPRPAPAVTAVPAKPAPKTNRPAVSGRGQQRPGRAA